MDLFVQSFSSATLLAALVVLLVVYVVSSLGSKEDRNGPPGPKALPLLGNLLQLDLKRPYYSLLEVRYCLLGFVSLLSLSRSDRKMPPTTRGMSILATPATKSRSRVNDQVDRLVVPLPRFIKLHTRPSEHVTSWLHFIFEECTAVITVEFDTVYSGFYVEHLVWLLTCHYVPVGSFPKHTDPCSPFIWDPKKWWFWLDTRR